MPCRRILYSDITTVVFPDCICPKDLNPVCGNDGVTYNNKCLARCNNVVKFKCENGCEKCRDVPGGNTSNLHSWHCIYAFSTSNLVKYLFTSQDVPHVVKSMAHPVVVVRAGRGSRSVDLLVTPNLITRGSMGWKLVRSHRNLVSVKCTQLAPSYVSEVV